jgi:hypothetical protein
MDVFPDSSERLYRNNTPKQLRSSSSHNPAINDFENEFSDQVPRKSFNQTHQITNATDRISYQKVNSTTTNKSLTKIKTNSTSFPDNIIT